MRLTRLFALSLIVVALLVSGLLGRIVADRWHHFRTTQEALASMELARKAMVAAEKVSFERGPANGVLGDALPADPAKRERLSLARSASDTALSDLARSLGRRSWPAAAHALQAVQTAQDRLEAARRLVDEVAALPPPQRHPQAVMGAVQAMFDIIPLLLEAVTALSDAVVDIDSRFIGALTNARLAVELREYAGRIGSQFTAALTTGSPLGPAEQEALQLLRGRVAQLRDLISLSLRAGHADPRVVAAMRQMEARYFGEALALVAEVEHLGQTGRPYGMDTAGFAARYVPPMGSIVELRDVLLEVSIEGARQASERETRALAVACAVGLVVLAALATLMWDLRRRVLQPLVAATHALIETARGDDAPPPPPSDRRDEIGDMLRALAVLHANTQEMHRLADERQHLIEELKELSSVDPLTGALNRRAFDDAVRAHRQSPLPADDALSIVLFDIDHFKAINDQYGHEVGDRVLRHVADVARSQLRDNEPLARYGGEEFIVMPRHCDLEGARALAERLREAIASQPARLGDGRELTVTACFGVAAACERRTPVEQVVRAADRALYQAKDQGRNCVVVADGADEPAAVPGS